MDVIEEDSFVLVYRDRRRRWLVRPRDTPKLHTHLGILDVEGLVGKEYGVRATTTLGDDLYVLRPTIEDLVMKLSRKTQVIYPKDLGLMVVKLGVHAGSKVLETGTGSGATTALMAYLVQPDGMIFTYDLNPDFQEVARKNVERLGLSKSVTFKVADARLGFDVQGMDAAILDVGDPWEVVRSMRESLKPSAPMVAITPTTNQAERLVAKMKEEGFVAIETVEILLRHLEARVGMTRPSNIMVGHTAYLTFGRTTRGPPPEPQGQLSNGLGVVPMAGVVRQINVKPRTRGERGLPKAPVDSAHVFRSGVEGDYNVYRHEEKGDDPDSALLVFPVEMIEALNKEGWPVRAGDLGENLTTSGIPYSSFEVGKKFGAGDVQFQISRPCDPCDNLYLLPYVGSARGPTFLKVMLGRRGWYARVLKEGRITAGDAISEIPL